MCETSIIIPCRNEAENIGDLLDEIVAACAGIGAYEILVIDDASDDGMSEILAERMATTANLRVIRHDRSGGQSAGVHSGVRAAKGNVCCTLDGDGQNPGTEIPNMIAPFKGPNAEKIGLVAGQRVDRQDTFSKRYASKFANVLRAKILKDGTRDTGCGLKAFRRDDFLNLPYFDHMHRYLPALFARDGWEIAHVDVSHRARGGGRSHYSNLQRGFVGVVDLLGVAWLLRRRKKARPTEVTPERGEG